MERLYKNITKNFILKTVVGIAIIVFIVLIIPILDLADVNHATGDDYGYSIRTRHAWIATHSVWDVLKGAWDTAYYTWFSWQGTWFDIFLFSLQPEVFHEDAYIIVPYITLFLWIGSTFWLLKRILMNRFGVDKWYYLLFTIGFMTLNLQFIPGTKSSIFWYNGITHYMVPFVMCQLLLVFLLKYTECYKKRHYVGILIIMTLLGGANYQAALFGVIATVYIGIYEFLKKKNYRVFFLGIPLILLAIGLVISMKAPGNKNRGGEEFGFSIGKIFGTIGESFARGTIDIGKYFVEKPLVFIGLLCLFGICLVMFLKVKELPKISHGIWIIVALYCLHCAMYAPEIFAGVDVSQGVKNTNYQVLLLVMMGVILILANWLAQKIHLSEKEVNSYLLPVGFFVCFVLAFILRSELKETTSWKCYDYSRIGRDDIYEEQMDYWLSLLLNEDLKEVILPSINDDQGPMMFMPVIDNPEAWTNSVTGNYFKKDYLVAIPRDEWIAIYGEPVIGEIPEEFLKE